MELPPYHKPKWGHIIRATLMKAWDIFSRAFRVIAIVSIVFYLLSYNWFDSDSILTKVGQVIEPVTSWFGMNGEHDGASSAGDQQGAGARLHHGDCVQCSLYDDGSRDLQREPFQEVDCALGSVLSRVLTRTGIHFLPHWTADLALRQIESDEIPKAEAKCPADESGIQLLKSLIQEEVV